MASSPPPAPNDADPIIIGAADTTNRTTTPLEPAHLITTAIASALSNTGLAGAALARLKREVDELALVKQWTWPYDDLAGLVAGRCGLGRGEDGEEGLRTRVSEHGGNWPIRLLDESCRGIARGERRVVVLGGGEALGSLTACAKSGDLPPPGWTPTTTKLDAVFSPTTRALPDDLGGRHGIGAPVQVYPLYENGFRAHRRQSIRDNHEESAALYAEFAEVAARNEYAWSYGRKAKTREQIAAVGGGNRMIGFPYPLLMNAFNNVNLAAAVVVTSVGVARELGVSEDRWVYVLGAAGTSESAEFWNRSSFHHSPAISQSIDTALAASGLTKDNVDMHDFYSCFPIVPKLACRHLGLPMVGSKKPITLLGGLTSFGGAGNNYSMHALTASTRALRSERAKKRAKRSTSLVLANGGVLTYQHATILSSQPREGGRTYPTKALLPQYVDVSSPEVDEQAEGEGTVETYTVDFGRDGSPKKGHIVGRLASGRRFLANAGDGVTLREMAGWDQEVVGRTGTVKFDGSQKRSLFILHRRPESGGPRL